MRHDTIYIRTRSHVVRMCPRTGIFDVVPSEQLYPSRLEYNHTIGNDLFEDLFKLQFAMSGCADEILNMFYTVLGLWLNPKSEETSVVIIGRDAIFTDSIIRLMEIIVPDDGKHTLFTCNMAPFFICHNRNCKIDFAFRACQAPNETFNDKWRTVLENERELENIQFKAIQALSAYFKNGGFKQPEYCLNALKNLTTDDHMDRYINEQFVICNDSYVSTEANNAHKNYLEWHFANEIRQPHLGKRKFFVTLREMGFRVDRSNNVYRISGVLLKNQRTN